MKNPILETKSQRILFSPLNWGFGHVSRSIELIRHLVQNHNKIFVCCNEIQAAIYTQYFFSEEIEIIRFDGYPFSFKAGESFALSLIKSSLSIVQFMKKERKQVEELCKELSIDLVLSDHRYGFKTDKVKSVFITHQLQLPVNKIQVIGNRIHQRLIRKFDEIWIVDEKERPLAGYLSKATDRILNSTFHIGHLSRFSYDCNEEKKNIINYLLIVSGPKEHWQELIQQYEKQFSKEEVLVLMPFKQDLNLPIKWKIHIATNWVESDRLIIGAENILGYCGYSTLMDLKTLNKSAKFLIPCKGQLEQEYLYKYNLLSK